MNTFKLNNAIENAKKYIVFEVGTITDNENREVFEYMVKNKIIKRIPKIRKNKIGIQYTCYKYVGN